jgi:hypothetical protein
MSSIRVPSGATIARGVSAGEGGKIAEQAQAQRRRCRLRIDLQPQHRAMAADHRDGRRIGRHDHVDTKAQAFGEEGEIGGEVATGQDDLRDADILLQHDDLLRRLRPVDPAIGLVGDVAVMFRGPVLQQIHAMERFRVRLQLYGAEIGPVRHQPSALALIGDHLAERIDNLRTA